MRFRATIAPTSSIGNWQSAIGNQVFTGLSDILWFVVQDFGRC